MGSYNVYNVREISLNILVCFNDTQAGEEFVQTLIVDRHSVKDKAEWRD